MYLKFTFRQTGFLILFTHWVFKVCFDQWPRDNTMVERSPPSGIIPGRDSTIWSGCEENLAGRRKKMERQKPSQCKCLLPFLTGTLSHQLQHKIKTWLPNWSISNAVNILNAASHSETKTPDENTWQKPVGWKTLSRETDEENSGSFRLGSWRHHAVISAPEKLFTPNSIWF